MRTSTLAGLSHRWLSRTNFRSRHRDGTKALQGNALMKFFVYLSQTTDTATGIWLPSNKVVCPRNAVQITEPIVPLLNNLYFLCGTLDESSREPCILKGNDVQVIFTDPNIPGYTVETVNFFGITFSHFKKGSIEAVASAPTKATFMQCTWQVRHLHFIVLWDPFTINICVLSSFCLFFFRIFQTVTL